jgi:hypothetical protein
MARDPYTKALIESVKDMIEEGVTDPHAEEIAAHHFRTQAEKLGNEIIHGVRVRLKKIRDALVEADHAVALVSAKYYYRTRHHPSFREEPPDTIEKARLCLPIGPGNRSAGLHVATSENDLIVAAALEQNMNGGAAKLRINLDRLADAHRNRHLGKPDAAKLIESATKRATPDHAAELKEIATPNENALPAPPAPPVPEEAP